jgi:hypothetical protein
VNDRGFHANPRKVAAFGTDLDRLGDDAQRAQEYVLEYVLDNSLESTTGQRVSGFGVLFSNAEKTLRQVRDEVAENYRRLKWISKDSGTEVGKVATNYRNADFATSQRLDRLWRK